MKMKTTMRRSKSIFLPPFNLVAVILDMVVVVVAGVVRVAVCVHLPRTTLLQVVVVVVVERMGKAERVVVVKMVMVVVVVAVIYDWLNLWSYKLTKNEWCNIKFINVQRMVCILVRIRDFVLLGRD